MNQVLHSSPDQTLLTRNIFFSFFFSEIFSCFLSSIKSRMFLTHNGKLWMPPPYTYNTFFYPWSDIYINLKEWWMSTPDLRQTGLAFRCLFCGPCSKEGCWIFQCLKSMEHKTDLWEEWDEWQKFTCHFLRFLVAMETIILVCTVFLCLGEQFFVLWISKQAFYEMKNHQSETILTH